MSDQKKYTNQITLFQNENVANNGPIMRGKIKLKVEDFMHLVDNETGEVELDVAVWGKLSQNNKPYWQGSIKEPYKAQAQAQTVPAHAPATTTGNSFKGSASQAIHSFDSDEENDLPF